MKAELKDRIYEKLFRVALKQVTLHTLCIFLCLCASVSVNAQKDVTQADTLHYSSSKGKWFIAVDSQTSTEWEVGVPATDVWAKVEKKEDASGVWVTLQMNEADADRCTTIKIEKEGKILRIPLKQRGKTTKILNHELQYEFPQLDILPDWGKDWYVTVFPPNEWGGYAQRYGDNGFLMFLPENTGRESRDLDILICNTEEKLAAIRVRQLPNPLPLSHTHYTVGSWTTDVNLRAGTTDSLMFRFPEWITLKGSKQLADEKVYTLHIQPNESATSRCDFIHICKKEGFPSLSVPVIQYASSSYVPGLTESLSASSAKEDYSYLELFADSACSALKPEVTTRKINRCRNAFFRNLALRMLRNEYDTEFRIQTYHARMNPDIQARQNGTEPFSRLDNPTGIEAFSDEPLIVLVDREIPGLSLLIQDLDTNTGFDGYGGTSYELHRGVNTIHSVTGGLCYVLYHSATPDEESPVKIHFAGGGVNGYFDIEKHTNADGSSRWKELLSRASGTYFDVLSPYVHFTLPTEDLRRYVPDVKPLLAAYDTLICHQQKFEGLEKYNRWIKNRLYIHPTDKKILYASPYHIGFQREQLPPLLDTCKLKTTYCWGPAHELGHILQVRPSMLWPGMIEVTNNIQSMEIQRIWGNLSRLHADSRMTNGYTDVYEQAMNLAFVENHPYAYLTDWFDLLVPFWQLRLYVMDVCGKDDFYKDVYEAARLMNGRTDLTGGQRQLEFIYNSCVSAEMDLRPFFRRWGWLTPVERMYGADTLSVTVGDIDNVNSRIDSLNLPLQTSAATYITDKTLHLYLHPEPLQPGTARIDTITGRVQIEGATGAIAYEVYCGDKLLGVSWNGNFKVKKLPGQDVSELAVWGVSPDNQREKCALVFSNIAEPDVPQQHPEQILADLLARNEFFEARKQRERCGEISIVTDLFYEYKMHEWMNQPEKAAICLERMFNEFPDFFGGIQAKLEFVNLLLGLWVEVQNYEKVFKTYDMVESFIRTSEADDTWKQQQYDALSHLRSFTTRLVGVPKKAVSRIEGERDVAVDIMDSPVLTCFTHYNGIRLRTCMDTGSDYGLLLTEKAAEQVHAETVSEQTSEYMLENKPVQTHVAVIDSLQIGSVLFTNVLATVVHADSLKNGVEAIVGLPLLKKTGAVELDWNSNKMNLKLASEVTPVKTEPNMYFTSTGLYVRTSLNSINYSGKVDTGDVVNDGNGILEKWGPKVILDFVNMRLYNDM